jgi:uncharacterized protein (TIGR03086 family)
VPVELLEGTFIAIDAVLHNVTSGQLDDPTPCESWNVRDLINHIVGGTFFFAGVAGSEEMSGDGHDVDFAQGDYQAAFVEGSQRCLAAFSQEGAMQTMMKLPSGEVPGSRCVWRASRELLVHGWDLATATGQLISVDDALVEQLLETPPGDIPDAIRGDEPKPFAPRVQVADDAPAMSRLVAYMGRVP